MSGGISPIVFSYHDDIDDQLRRIAPAITEHDCRDLGFNPMRIVQREEFAHIESAGQIRDIFQAIFPDLGDLQTEALRGAVKQSYESFGWGVRGSVTPSEPPFDDFLNVLRAIPKPDRGIKTLLGRLAELEDFGFFRTADGDASLLDSQVPRLVKVHAVGSDAVQRGYASFVLYRIYQDMFRRGRQERITHAIIFDEAHKASRLKLLPTMAKECRKYGLALIVASQEAKDFDSGLFAAIANYLVLRVSDPDAKTLSKTISPSTLERNTADKLKALPKFHGLFAGEGNKRPLQIKLSS
jgi:hypothetical protein